MGVGEGGGPLLGCREGGLQFDYFCCLFSGVWGTFVDSSALKKPFLVGQRGLYGVLGSHLY